MRNSMLRKTAVLFSLALIAAVFTSNINAQGRYRNVYSKRDVSGIISKLEQTSNTFRRDFDRNLDDSSLNGTNEEDRLNQIVQRYERDLNQLRREFDRNDSWWESRRNVEEVMDSARSVNVMMNTLPFARRLERQWRNMRRDLNKLADTFDLPALDNAGGGGGGGNVPNWAEGTFYGRNPQDGRTIVLTISRNGNVTVDFQGSTTTGFYSREQISIYGATARVTRLKDGIRTTRVDTGEVIDYYRTGQGGGDGGIGGDVPNWAVGTFYGRNPQTGGTITMTISRNGSVSVNMDGVIFNGTLNNTRLFINGARATVRRLGNGIRTTNDETGERIDYSRQ